MGGLAVARSSALGGLAVTVRLQVEEEPKAVEGEVEPDVGPAAEPSGEPGVGGVVEPAAEQTVEPKVQPVAEVPGGRTAAEPQ